MSSKIFYGIFAFTVAFMLGLVANWAMTREYVSNYNRHTNCPYQSRMASEAQPAHSNNQKPNTFHCSGR